MHHAAWGRNGAPDILVALDSPWKPIGVGDSLRISYYDGPTEGGQFFTAEITKIRVLEKDAVEFVIERDGGENGRDTPVLLLQVHRAKARVGWRKTLGELLGQRASTVQTIVLPTCKEAEEQSSDRKKFTLPRSSIERFVESLKNNDDNSSGFGEIKITEETTRTSSLGEGVHGVKG